MSWTKIKDQLDKISELQWGWNLDLVPCEWDVAPYEKPDKELVKRAYQVFNYLLAGYPDHPPEHVFAGDGIEFIWSEEDLVIEIYDNKISYTKYASTDEFGDVDFSYAKIKELMDDYPKGKL